jgi:hypothetical protein
MRAGSRRWVIPAIGSLAAVWVSSVLLSGNQSAARPEEDLVLGTWSLNVEKSRWTPGPAPRSQTRTYESHQDGVKATVKTVYSDGHSTSVEYVAKYDAIEYPLSGSPDAERVSLKKVSPNEAQVALGHAGKVIGTARRVISRDGKTMTITYKGELEGRSVANVSVYDRQ